MKNYQNFYRYSERDLMTVLARDLCEGDYITLVGDNMKYGIVCIENVTKVQNIVSIHYNLPPGACMSSEAHTEVAVFWNLGPIPTVQVYQDIPLKQPVLILKRQGGL